MLTSVAEATGQSAMAVKGPQGRTYKRGRRCRRSCVVGGNVCHDTAKRRSSRRTMRGGERSPASLRKSRGSQGRRPRAEGVGSPSRRAAASSEFSEKGVKERRMEGRKREGPESGESLGGPEGQAPRLDREGFSTVRLVSSLTSTPRCKAAFPSDWTAGRRYFGLDPVRRRGAARPTGRLEGGRPGGRFCRWRWRVVGSSIGWRESRTLLGGQALKEGRRAGRSQRVMQEDQEADRSPRLP